MVGAANLANRLTKLERGFVPKTELARPVEYSDKAIYMFLTDGGVLSVPLRWFPRLRVATPEQRAGVEISGGGISLHWPDIDEDLSVANLLAGVDPLSA